MSIEIKVPPLPESVSDATLVAWHKSVGDGVARDENLVDLETDKVVLEVPAPAAGTLTKIVVEDGATVVAGDLLAILEEGGSPTANIRRWLNRLRERSGRHRNGCLLTNSAGARWLGARAGHDADVHPIYRVHAAPDAVAG